MKVGDIVILIKGDSHYMNDLIGVPCKITKFVHKADFIEIYHDKLNENETNYFISADTFNVVPEEIWNSPLYKVMREEDV